MTVSQWVASFSTPWLLCMGDPHPWLHIHCGPSVFPYKGIPVCLWITSCFLYTYHWSLPLSPTVTIKMLKFSGTHPWLSQSLLLLPEVLSVEPIACMSVEGTEAQEAPHCYGVTPFLPLQAEAPEGAGYIRTVPDLWENRVPLSHQPGQGGQVLHP